MAVADRDVPSMDETVRLVVDDGGHAVAVAADVTDPASVSTMVETAVDRLHGPAAASRPTTHRRPRWPG